jgi:hypothetical protein
MQTKKEPPKAIVPKNKNAKVYSTANDPLQITDEMFEQDMLVRFLAAQSPKRLLLHCARRTQSSC